jgi:hypothetical protein
VLILCLAIALGCWRRKVRRGYIIPWSGFLGYQKSYNDILHMDSLTVSQLKVN